VSSIAGLVIPSGVQGNCLLLVSVTNGTFAPACARATVRPWLLLPKPSTAACSARCPKTSALARSIAVFARGRSTFGYARTLSTIVHLAARPATTGYPTSLISASLKRQGQRCIKHRFVQRHYHRTVMPSGGDGPACCPYPSDSYKTRCLHSSGRDDKLKERRSRPKPPLLLCTLRILSARYRRFLLQ
jgi:hypothetical protein